MVSVPALAPSVTVSPSVVDDVGVIAGAARHRVGPEAAIQQVVAGPAVQGVVAGAADQQVGAGAGVEAVVAVEAQDELAARGTGGSVQVDVVAVGSVHDGEVRAVELGDLDVRQRVGPFRSGKRRDHQLPERVPGEGVLGSGEVELRLVGVPAPPSMKSLPPSPSSPLLPELPMSTLAAAVPSPLMLPVPVRVRFSTLSVSLSRSKEIDAITSVDVGGGRLDHVVAGVVDDVGVVAVAARHVVVADAAVEQVVAAVAGEDVVIAVAEQHVGLAAAEKVVLARRADHQRAGVGTGRTDLADAIAVVVVIGIEADRVVAGKHEPAVGVVAEVDELDRGGRTVELVVTVTVCPLKPRVRSPFAWRCGREPGERVGRRALGDGDAIRATGIGDDIVAVGQSEAVGVVAEPAVEQVAALGGDHQVVDDDGIAAAVVRSAHHEANGGGRR